MAEYASFASCTSSSNTSSSYTIKAVYGQAVAEYASFAYRHLNQTATVEALCDRALQAAGMPTYAGESAAGMTAYAGEV